MVNDNDYEEITGWKPSDQSGNESVKPSDVQPKKRPETIEELQQWYVSHRLPPEEVTRFFIGKNYTGPKAFGIYKNEKGECVVYKNKASGERAVRYQGPDEAFAVNELLQRLKEEIAKQKAKRASRLVGQTGSISQTDSASQISSSTVDALDNVEADKSGIGRFLEDTADNIFDFVSDKRKRKGCFTVFLFIAALGFYIFGAGNSVPNGYYRYNGTHYYRQGSSWYYYNPTNRNWFRSESLDKYITHDNADQYRIYGFTGELFENSEWYDDGRSWYDNDDDGDDDDDSYWDDDDDSWDSDDTDWDSDW